MWNARLNEAQAGIKIAGRNINNLRYADDTTLMAESEEELKSLSHRPPPHTPTFPITGSFSLFKSWLKHPQLREQSPYPGTI